MDNTKGKLFGIGVGPGDPELLTLKAVNTIRGCGTVAIPKAGGKSGDREMTAYSIVEKYLRGKELLECRFVMENDMEKRREARQAAANDIMKVLDTGKDVGFITLGDPTTYSTYMYIHEIVVKAGFDTEIIPGITSYTAAAAELGISLCENDEILSVIPGAQLNSPDAVDRMLNIPGNKVIMKSNLPDVIEKLKERGYGDKTFVAYRATMDGQKLYRSINEYEQSPESGYFTVAICKEL